VSPSLPGTSRSRFARLHSGEPGIDPYTRTVSDVYQDLFGEGSFIGKGIYDVDAFERSMDGRCPDNRILSHDLLEGCFARSGLLSDVELFEDYPATYAADAARRHRWIRGDWQIASWLLPWVPGAGRSRYRNPLVRPGAVEDRRQPAAQPGAGRAAAAAAGRLARSGSALAWTLVVVGICWRPPCSDRCCSSCASRARRRCASTWPPPRVGRYQWAQAGLALACLPHEALPMRMRCCAPLAHAGLASAATRVVPVRGRHRRRAPGLPGSLRAMWMSPAIALGTAAYLALARPSVLLLAAPMLLLWLARPASRGG
jgi:cyclic beta-1,2-glucan synthetase